MVVPGIAVPSLRVPGLLSDDELAEARKQRVRDQNAMGVVPPTTSATDFAGKVADTMVDSPMRRIGRLVAPLAGPGGTLGSMLARGTSLSPVPETQAAQEAEVQRRSDILADTPAGRAISTLAMPGSNFLTDDSLLGRLGALTPEEAAAEQEQRVEDAKAAENAQRTKMEARRALRDLTDDQAAAMGLPVSPGGVDPDTTRLLEEQNQRREAFEQKRLQKAEERTQRAEQETPTAAWWLDAARQAYKSLAGMGLNSMRGIVLPLEMAIGDGSRSDVRAWIDTADAAMEKLLPGDKARSKDFMTKLAAGGGSMLGFMIGGALGSVVGLPASSATLMMGALSGGAEQVADAERFDISGVQKLMAYFFGMGIGATEAIPLNRALMRMENATGGTVSRLLQQTMAGSMEEFIQELGQSIGTDIVAQHIYDENREIDWAEAFESAAVGGILGAMMGGSFATLQESGVLGPVTGPVQQPVVPEAIQRPQPTQEDVATAQQPAAARAEGPSREAATAEQTEDYLSAVTRFMTETQEKFEATAADIDAAGAVAPAAEPEVLAEVAPVPQTAGAAADALIERARQEQRPATVVAAEFAETLPRPALFDAPTVAARGGTVPAPGIGGTITLRHFAAQQRPVLDPAMRGTGPLRGVERARLSGPDAVDRTYYGVRSGPDFVQPGVSRQMFTRLTPEERAAAKRLAALGVNRRMVEGALEGRYREAMRSRGYQNEGLGDFMHEVEVRPDDLYNAAEDPMGLRDQLPDGLTPAERSTRYERLVKEAGFRGMYFPQSELGQTAILFDAAEPSRVVDERYGLPVEEIAKPADFAAPTAETFVEKGGWAVVTGTREAVGPHDAPANVEANERLRRRLRRDGVKFMEVSGAYQGTPQGVSFLIFAPEDYAKRLGQQYGQESVLTRQGLEYTDGSGRLVPAVPAETVVGDEARQLDFFSELPDGTAFSMGLDFDAATGADTAVEQAADEVMAAVAETATEATGDQWTPQELRQTAEEWAAAVADADSGHPLRQQLVEIAERVQELGEDLPPEIAELAETIIQEAATDGGTDQQAGRQVGQPAAGEPGAVAEGAAPAQRAGDGLGAVAAVGEPDAEAQGGAAGGEVLAQTAGGRGPLAAEPTRPRQGVPGAPDAAQAEIGLQQIADNFRRMLDLTVRQGRFTLRGANVVGQYMPRQDTVRLRSPTDLSALVHEGGHAFMEARRVAGDTAFDRYVATHVNELQAVAKRLYGGDTSAMDNQTLNKEGFAEFFRVYVTNRQFVEKSYPKLTADFDAYLDAQNPQLKEGFAEIGDQFNAWLQLPSATLLRNMVVSGQRLGPVNRALQEIRESGVGQWMREVGRGALQTTTNRYAAINRLVSDMLNLAQEQTGQALDLARASNPAVLIRLASNSGQRGVVQLTDGVMPYRSTEPATRGLREALLRYHGLGPDQNLGRIDPERQRDFAAFLIALRGIDEYRRYAEGKIERPPLAATLGDLRVTIDEMNAKYGADFAHAAAIVHEFGMGLWQKSYDAGLISKQTYKDGLDRKFYAPLQRDMSDRGPAVGDISGTSAARPVKRFRGSDRNIIDPMDALMQKTFSLERVIAENEVKRTLAALADKVGRAGALVERIPAHQLIGSEYSVQEVGRALTKDDTLTDMDAADLMATLEAAIEEGNRIALFRSEQAQARGENIVFFWEKGKLAALQIKDGDLGADVINILNGIGAETLPAFVDPVVYTSGVFRSAITSWPDFLMVNFIRDQLSAWILTDVGYKPFVSGLRGVADEVRQKDWARQYNAAMGVMGGMNSAALHKARFDRDISSLRKKGYLPRVFGGGGYFGAIRGFARLTEVTETGSRLGIFRNAYERAKADGLTDWEASIEASYMATDYIDFGLNGNRMTLWRRTIPFLNAQLQGLYKMMRTLGGDEVRQRRGLRFVLGAYLKDLNGLDLSRTERQALRTGRKAWIKMLSLGFLGAALTFLFEDDPDYQDTSEYLRATGWVIPLGDGEIAYIPKPFELAMFSNIVERALESASGDGEAKNRLLRGMALNLTPPFEAPLLSVIREQRANFDNFAGRAIVPDHMRALAPEYQYNHFTSEFAKQLGETMGWSPLRIDHALNGLGASAYRDMVGLYNTLDPNRPQSDPTDWPFTRRFVRDARRGAVSSQDFWTYASTTEGSLRRAEVTYKRALDEGRDDRAAAFLRTQDDDHEAYALLNVHFKAEYKRLNPFRRARDVTSVVSALRREMPTDQGMINTETSEPIRLSASKKAEIDEALSELARREVRNAMVTMKTPGWANKAPLPVEPTKALIRAISPEAADELDRRWAKAKIYDADTVREYWPEVQNRILQDREDAFLDDILAIAIAEATR